MLVSLRFDSAPRPATDDVLGQMLECHERIRRFCAMSLQLARPEGVPLEQLAEAATRVEHYFTVGLPRHAADEDHSLMPRLLAAGLALEERQALEEMAQQHEEIGQRVGRLSALWTTLREAPQLAPGLAGRLGPASAEFERLLELHLTLEERCIFPAARRLLTPTQLAEMRAEFRRRRALS